MKDVGITYSSAGAAFSDPLEEIRWALSLVLFGWI